MVGMNMGVDDVKNLHAGLVGSLEIRLDGPDRVNDGARRLSTAAQKIGGTDRVGMQELTDDHR